jgi:hypothetical protein
MARRSFRNWLNWTTRLQQRGWRRTDPPNRRRSRPHLETLEGRCVPSTVTNLSDHDPGSLRDAIATTPAGGTVDFQPGLSGTITLTSGELGVNKDLTITGPGAGVITVSGNQASRVFDISATFTVAISGLTIADGDLHDTSDMAHSGGGIYNGGTLMLTECLVSGHRVEGMGGVIHVNEGGGVFNAGTLTITDSTVSANVAFFSTLTAQGFGGGIYNTGTAIISNSTLSNNSGGFAAGGGIYNGGTLTVTNCTLSGNSMHSGSGGGGIYNSGGGTFTLSGDYQANCQYRKELHNGPPEAKVPCHFRMPQGLVHILFVP